MLQGPANTGYMSIHGNGTALGLGQTRPPVIQRRRATLIVLTGPSAGSEYEFESPVVLGRADSDIHVMDPHISRRHARLTPVGSAVQIADLGSSNGTWVDGRRLLEPEVLDETALMRIGQTQFEVIPAGST